MTQNDEPTLDADTMNELYIMRKRDNIMEFRCNRCRHQGTAGCPFPVDNPDPDMFCSDLEFKEKARVIP